MIRTRLGVLLMLLCLSLTGCPDDGGGPTGGTAPGAGTVVYLADQDTVGVFELYLGSSGTKLNPALGAGRTVTNFAVTPGATAVVYIADQDQDDVYELYRVNLATPGTSAKLNGTIIPVGGDVTDFAITPDGSAVVYRADQNADEVFELYRTVLGTATNSRLNPAYAGGQDIETFVILPDSTGVIYRADQNTEGVSELYRVLFANAPTSDRLVAPALVPGQNVGAFAATADSANVVYIANRSIATNQVDFVPAGGGANIQLNGVLTANGNVMDSAVTPDGLSVVYRADQEIDEVFELYRVTLATPGSSTKLNGPLVAGGDVTSFGVIPGSSGVVYIADQITDDVFELFRTVFSGVNSQLNPAYVAGQNVEDFVLFPNGGGVVYRADQTTAGVNEIYRAVFGFPGTVQLNPGLVVGKNVSTYAVAPDSNSAIYRANEDNVAVVELYRATFATAGTSTKLNSPLVPGENVTGFSVK